MALVKTYTPKPQDIEHKWWIVDAEGQTLGRLATHLATILRGKHKPMYTPNLDTGDYIVLINAQKIHVTGNRMETKIYYRHSKYQGGLTQTRLIDQLARFPERPITDAVKGMLPKNALGRQMLQKLKVYPGAEHPHAAQKPEVLEFK